MPAYSGVTGVTQFDENGDCNTKPFIGHQIRDNEYHLVGTEDDIGGDSDEIIR